MTHHQRTTSGGESAQISLNLTFYNAGGGPGSRGENLLLRHKGPIVNLGAKNFVNVNPGVSLSITSQGQRLIRDS